MCKGALRSDAAGICADFTALPKMRLLKMPAASLTQERLQRSLLGLKGRPVWIVLFL